MRNIALFVGLAFLTGCGADRLAGGGGIETNNTLGIQIQDSLGNPVPRAGIRIHPAQWIDTGSNTQFLLTYLANKQGFVSMSIPDGQWTLEAMQTGTAALRTFLLDSDLTIAPIRLAKTARLTGTVYQEFPGQRVWISVVGTTHTAFCDSSGAYTLEELPPALLTLKPLSESSHQDTISLQPGSIASLPWTGRPDLRSLDGTGSILIDDFSASRPSIAVADTTAGWYLTSDGNSGGSTVIRRSDSVRDSVFERFLVPNIPTGQAGSFQGFFDIDTTDRSRSHYAQIGLSFHDTSRCIDLSRLDSVTFLASGTDSIRAEFLGRLNYSTPDMASTPGHWVRLDSSWKAVTLRASDLATPPSSTHPEINWSSLSGCIEEFRFYTDRPARLHVSNLRFWGPPLGNFLHPVR
jgi:hypothetical protein